MDFDLEWHQEELKRTAREYLTRQCTLDNLLEWEESATGYSQSIYREMGELGWLALGHSGAPGEVTDIIELGILYEEFGRAALPGPHFWSSFLAGHLVAALGGSGEWVEALAAGRRIAAVAVDEVESSGDPDTLRLTAKLVGADFRLDGTKAFVPWASAADTILVLARTGNEAGHLTFFAVPVDADGVELEDVPMLSGEKAAFVHMNSVRLPAHAQLGDLGSGWSRWRDLLTAATVVQAAQLTGIAEAALELAVQYARERIAFGKPIGSFQAIQHKCAEMAADRDGARFLTFEAECLINEGHSSDPRVLMARAFAAGAAHRVTKEAHQIFAAAGFVRTHPLNFLYRRLKGIETSLGDVDDHLERTVAALTG
ncbi:MAG TPA: acyl-CoA dehydrogenase family protein [Candidatus Micrarchaeaceae archaeon]|nr:acyl-CoA dehydrogenase family protein [Candidatus Micrarchaeaceae archaeon]